MKKLLSVSCLLSLFVWNALLGQFNGVVLCLQEHLELHILEQCDTAEDCGNAAEPSAGRAAKTDCLDFEFVAELLTVVRPAGDKLPAPKTAAVVPDSGFFEKIKTGSPSAAVDCMHSPRVPTHATPLNLMIARTMCLRI